MYEQILNTKERAFLHLMIYCAAYDNEITEGEAFELVKIINVHPSLKGYNLTEETKVFFQYKPEIINSATFLAVVIVKMNSKYPIAIYSYCVQVLIADSDLSENDNVLLILIGSLLNLIEIKRNVLKETYIARKILEMEGFK